MASFDAGDLVVKRSPPELGGMDIYRKGARYHKNSGDLRKVTFFNELGMRGLGKWIGRQMPHEKRSYVKQGCSTRKRKREERKRGKSAAFVLGRALAKSRGVSIEPGVR